MKTFNLTYKVFAVFFLVCSSANSTLIDRGNGLIYDDDLDITWLQDGLQFGKGNWFAANEWAESLVYGGFDDWRLPYMPQTDPSCEPVPTIDYLKYKNCTAGEMGHLYYIELGNDFAETNQDIRANNYGFFPFIKQQPGGYWTSTKFDPTLDWTNTGTEARIPQNDRHHWLFYLGKGTKFVFQDGNSRHAMAVRDGDVVPADSSGTLNEDLSFHTPSLNYHAATGTVNIWANFSGYGTTSDNRLVWSLIAWGTNTTPLTGEMTGEVSADLNIQIKSLHIGETAATYWANFEYYGTDNGNHLWTLKEYGENP